MKTDERIDKYLGEGKTTIKNAAKKMETDLNVAIDELFASDEMDWLEGTGLDPKEQHKAFMLALKKLASSPGWFGDYFEA
jgi:hypothetical protein